MKPETGIYEGIGIVDFVAGEWQQMTFRIKASKHQVLGSKIGSRDIFRLDEQGFKGLGWNSSVLHIEGLTTQAISKSRHEGGNHGYNHNQLIESG